MRSLKKEREFLPAALAIVDTPPNPVGRSVFWAVVGFFLVATTWAVFSEVDIVAVARGRVVPQGYSKVIQPLEIGTVKTIHVREGQRVSADQLLLELDDVAAAADVKRLEADRNVAKQAANRLRKLASWSATEVAANTSLPSVELEDHLTLAQWREHQANLQTLISRAAERKAERRSALQELEKLEAVLPLIDKRAASERQLADKQLFSAHDYLKTEQERVEASHELKRQRCRMEALEESLTAIRSQMVHATQAFRRQVLQRLQERERQLATLDQDLTKARRRLISMRLNAPVSGVVQQLAVHTEGAVVRPAQSLMVVVPDDTKLVVEALIENKDIGFVEEGQEAEIKVDAFPFTKYGTLSGKIEDLSDDAVQNESQGLIFKSIVGLTDAVVQIGNRAVRLTPGMTVSVEVKTGRRRLIEYFLSPLLKHAKESARER